MITYYADTGLHTHRFKADSDQEAMDEYPNALVWREDGKPMDDVETEGYEVT